MHKIIYTFLQISSSMKTGLVLLTLLGVFAALGSRLLPDDFYRLTLFEALIVLLLINLIMCTVKRITKTREMLFGRPKNVFILIRQWGLLVLHSGLILILVGGIINAFAGQSANVMVTEGEQVLIAQNNNGKRISLLLDEFEIELYENDMPSQYYSKVFIYSDETQEAEAVISVNHPLKYNKYKIYQQGYGSMVDVTVAGEENSSQYTAGEGDIINLPGGNWAVKVFRYVPDFDPANGMNSKSPKPQNPRVVYSIYKDNELLEIGAAPFGDIIKIGEEYSVKFTGVKPYSILRVKEDPGLPYAAAGGIIFMIGVALAEINIFKIRG